MVRAVSGAWSRVTDDVAGIGAAGGYCGAGEFGEIPGFLSLYTPTDRALAESLVHRAEAAGFKASW